MHMQELHLWCLCQQPVSMSGGRGRAEGGYAYQGQVPEGHSLLYSLITARRKDDLQPLSDLHICAQAFTFVLAGQHLVPF